MWRAGGDGVVGCPLCGLRKNHPCAVTLQEVYSPNGPSDCAERCLLLQLSVQMIEFCIAERRRGLQRETHDSEATHTFLRLSAKVIICFFINLSI